MDRSDGYRDCHFSYNMDRCGKQSPHPRLGVPWPGIATRVVTRFSRLASARDNFNPTCDRGCTDAIRIPAHPFEWRTHRDSFSHLRLFGVSRVLPRLDENGRVDGILIAKRDITEEVSRQRSLEEITTAMDAAKDCVFMFDADSLQFGYANQGAMKQVGYSFDEMRQMTPLDITSTSYKASFQSSIKPLLASPGTAANFRSEHQHRAGRLIPVEISLQLIPGVGRNGRFIAIVRDIAEQLAAEQAVKAAKEQAEASS